MVLQLPQAVVAVLQNYQRVVVAYSGGIDSHVLLHTLVTFYRLSVTVVHVNHQLNPKSDAWSAHCQTVCDALNVRLHIEKAKIVLNPGDSLEEKARDARYDILKKYVDKNVLLLTAHNLNDQAETFLFQALRGAGSRGLSAMPVKKPFGEGFLMRPFLTISREVIENYAKAHDLSWIEDDSNLDTKFSRNFLRQEIFPLLKKRFPTCMDNFARAARLLAEQEAIIAEIAQEDLQSIRHTHTLSITALLQYSEPRQRLILREWFRENNLRMPNEKHLKQILKDVVHAAPDADPVFQLTDVMLTRYKKALVLSKR